MKVSFIEPRPLENQSNKDKKHGRDFIFTPAYLDWMGNRVHRSHRRNRAIRHISTSLADIDSRFHSGILRPCIECN